MSFGEERIGTVLGGSYRLDRLIGQGGMGAVYEASHVRLPRRYAVKLLLPEILGQADVFDRFRREAEIASSLGIDNIAQVFDFNQTEHGLPYMVLELLEGEDLAALLERQKQLTVQQTARLVEQLCAALKAAHARDIVHRDLKPQNLFLCKREEGADFLLKVLDFGISKILSSGTVATRTGLVIGTPNYMSPEQAEGRAGIDFRTDIFAMGTIVYECLSGQTAFHAPTVPGVIYQVCHATPLPLRSLNSDVPEAVEVVVGRMMAKRRDDRYGSAVDARDAFLAACGIDAPRPQSQLSVASESAARPSPTRDTEYASSEIASPPSAAPPSAAAGATTLTSSASQAMGAPPRKRGFGMIAAAIALPVLGGLGVWALSRIGSETTSAPAEAVAPLAPAATRPAQTQPTPTPPGTARPSTAAPSAAAAPEPPATVEIILRVEPSDAKLTLDGKPASAGPIRLPRGDQLHLVEAKAPGYVTASREFLAAEDREIHLTLRKQATKPPPAPKRRRVTRPAPKRQPRSLGPVEDEI